MKLAFLVITVASAGALAHAITDACSANGAGTKTKATAKCSDLTCTSGDWGDFYAESGFAQCCEADAAYKQPCANGAAGQDGAASGLNCDGADTDTANFEISTTATCASHPCVAGDFAAGKCCVAQNEACKDSSSSCGVGSPVVDGLCAGAKCADSDFSATGASKCCHGKEICMAKSSDFFTCAAGFARTDDETTTCAGEACDATTDKAACCKALPACKGATWYRGDGTTVHPDSGKCQVDGQKVKATAKCTDHDCEQDFQGDNPHCCEADTTYREPCFYQFGSMDCTKESDDTANYEPVWHEAMAKQVVEPHKDMLSMQAWSTGLESTKCAAAAGCAAADFAAPTGACCVKKNQMCKDSSESCTGADVEVEPTKRCAAAVCTAADFGDDTKTCCRKKQALCSSASFACDTGKQLPSASESYEMGQIGGFPTGITKKCKAAACTEADDKATCCMPLPTCGSFVGKYNSYAAASGNGGPEEGQQGAAPPALQLGVPALVAATALVLAQLQPR